MVAVDAVREIRLARIPGRQTEPADFAVATIDPPAVLGPDHVRVRSLMIGLNAGLRHRLGTGRSTALGPALDLGDVPRSDAVAVVTQSNHPGFAVGDHVIGLLPWATQCDVPGDHLRTVEGDEPLRHLTLLGHVGLTAYVALFTIGRLTSADTIWISAAAGGVGTCAVQLARARGATVIASAGDDDRLDFLRTELGVDLVVDRRLDLEPQLRALAPDGLDLYVDGVGGDHLRVALDLMRDRGRVVAVGRAGSLDHAPVLQDTSSLITRRLSLTGFAVTDHEDQRPALVGAIADLEASQPRRLRPAATVRHGFDALPRAFCDLLAGRIIGRGVIDLTASSRGES